MGEMTIKVDDALLLELRHRAARKGVDAEALAIDLLRSALHAREGGRAAGARAILAAQTAVSPIDSVDSIREDRDRE